MSAAMLLIIVLVISQEAEIIAIPMTVLKKIVLPLVIQSGFAPPIKIKNPPQTNKIVAMGGIRPTKTKSIMFLESLNKSHRLQGAGFTDVPHGTRGHQLTACAMGAKLKIKSVKLKTAIKNLILFILRFSFCTLRFKLSLTLHQDIHSRFGVIY